MIRYVVYKESTGEIVSSGTGYDLDSHNEPGCIALEGHGAPHSHYVDLLEGRDPYAIITEKEEMGISVDTLLIDADGIDKATITGIPAGTSCLLPDGTIAVIDDGVLEFTADVVRTFGLRFTHLRYLREEVSIDSI